MDHFRKSNGFGRGIAAPQIGYSLRMIALNLGPEWNQKMSGQPDESFTIYNPVSRD